MSLYVVKNDRGEYLDGSEFGKYAWGYFAKQEAEHVAQIYAGHVVELVEKPEPVEVSKEENDVINEALGLTFGTRRISDFVRKQYVDHKANATQAQNLGERLMAAYVNGCTVRKPKRYALPMEGTKGKGPGEKAYFDHNYQCWTTAINDPETLNRDWYTVTQTQIDAAPPWVKALTPVEVSNDDED